jgi:hypothetical protein
MLLAAVRRGRLIEAHTGKWRPACVSVSRGGDRCEPSPVPTVIRCFQAVDRSGNHGIVAASTRGGGFIVFPAGRETPFEPARVEDPTGTNPPRTILDVRRPDVAIHHA